LVSNAIQFLASVCERPHYKNLFEDQNTLTSICEKVIVPNMEFRGNYGKVEGVGGLFFKVDKLWRCPKSATWLYTPSLALKVLNINLIRFNLIRLLL
jgi:hypothetical protein